MAVDAPTSATAVANFFLDLAAEEKETVPPIDQMKLQKLIYYAHAWWLAEKGHALFEDDVEAWPWGPVVRDVYLAFKDCGRAPIRDKRATELVRTGDGKFDYVVVRPDSPPDEVKDFLREVWDVHKRYSGVQLSNATHAVGEPWTVVKEQVGDLSGQPRIPNALIRDVFRSKLEPNQAANG